MSKQKMMNYSIYLSLIVIVLTACTQKENNATQHTDFETKKLNYTLSDSIEKGKTYLSVYSSIYSMTEDQTHNMTATISMRNTSENDTLFLTKANYYNTEGKLIRSYLNSATYLVPLETKEIVIASKDLEGGTGANFIFDWSKKSTTTEPLFEAVMISTSGSQGISFTSQGKRIH